MKSSMNISMSLENVMALMEGNPKFGNTLDSLQTAKHNLDIVKRYEKDFTNFGIEGLTRVKNLLTKNDLDSSFLIFDEKDINYELSKKNAIAVEYDKKLFALDHKISIIKTDRTLSDIQKEEETKKIYDEKLEISRNVTRVFFEISSLKSKLVAFKNTELDGDYLTKMFYENKSLIEKQLIGIDENSRINIETEMFKIEKYIFSIKEKKDFRIQIEDKIKEQILSAGVDVNFVNNKVNETVNTLSKEEPVIDNELEHENVATKSVEQDLKTSKQKDLDDAKLLVDEIKEETVKSDLTKRIEKVEESSIEPETKPLTFTEKYMNFKSDASKVKENVKYKVTKMRKACLGGYVKSMILGAGITSVAAVATMTVTSFSLPLVVVGAGIGVGYNLLKNKMVKNMNISLEENAKEMSTDIETVHGLFDGFCKMKKAYMEKQIKLKEVYNKFKNTELEQNISEVTPNDVENLEVKDENIDFENLSSDELNKIIYEYRVQGKEIPQNLKNKILSDSIEQKDQNDVDSLDIEVDARMGGR